MYRRKILRTLSEDISSRRSCKGWRLSHKVDNDDTIPIPDFQSLMLPIMKIAADREEHTARELRQRIGDDLGLTDTERKELLPSGTQPVLTNRIAWARVHLTMAGL